MTTKDALEANREVIEQALPAGWSYDMLVGAARAQAAAWKQKAVKPETLVQALLLACRCKILPDGRRASLRSVWNKQIGSNEAVYELDYKGLVEVVKGASPDIATVYADTVYENDEYEYTRGSSPKLHHRPPKLGADRGRFVGAYAIITYKNGFFEATDCDAAYIAQCRAQAKQDFTWAKWFDEMAKKAILKRLLKLHPATADLSDAIDADNKLFESAPRATKPQSEPPAECEVPGGALG